MANDSLQDLFKLDDESTIDELFQEAFEDHEKCQKRLNKISVAEASTPSMKDTTRGLVPQGEGENEVRVRRRQVCQTCPHPSFQ